MNVAQRDEEQVAKRWREKSERGGTKGGRESAWIPLCLTASVDITCWPHSGCTGLLAEKVLAADGGREGMKRGEESEEDQ